MYRLRRLRKSVVLRDLMAETHLSTVNFVMPYFVLMVNPLHLQWFFALILLFIALKFFMSERKWDNFFEDPLSENKPLNYNTVYKQSFLYSNAIYTLSCF